MTLIDIRTSEISYFSVFFNNFGLQTSIISGAICGSLSQTPALHKYDCPWSFVFLYFTAAAAALAISLYAILSALFLIVYGNGYALRGPLGSMVQTIDGMIYEQHTIVIAFVFSMVFYVVSMAGMYMVVMDDTCGPISFAIAILGGFITYSHCLRIFNRFRFINPLSRWAEEDDDPMKQFEDDNPEEKLKIGKELSASGSSHNTNSNSDRSGVSGHSKILRSVLGDNMSVSGASDTSSVAGGRRTTTTTTAPRASNTNQQSRALQEPTLLSRFFALATSNDFAFQYPHNTRTDSTATAAGASAAADLGLDEGTPDTLYQHLSLAHNSMEGYLTVKSAKKMIRIKDPWSRRYFVLKGKQIFIYLTRNAFQEHPEQPVNIRPIHLDGYSLIAGASSPPYAITLKPTDPEDIRVPWYFRCDTLYEFEAWLERFTKALQLSASEDLVVLKSGSSVSGRSVSGKTVRGSGLSVGVFNDTDTHSVAGSAVTTHSYL